MASFETMHVVLWEPSCFWSQLFFKNKEKANLKFCKPLRIETLESSDEDFCESKIAKNSSPAYLQSSLLQQIPCGLPPFVEKMPTKQGDELTMVWKNYKSGEDCGMQQAKTFDIVSSLDDEDRVRIFGLPANVQPPPGWNISTDKVLCKQY